MDRSTRRLVFGLVALMLVVSAATGWMIYQMARSRRHVMAGDAATERGDLAAAEAEYRAALAIAEGLPGQRQIEAEPYLALARTHEALSRLEEAEREAYQAVECYDVMVIGGGVASGISRNLLGRIRLARKDLAGAEEAFAQALTRLETWLPDKDPEIRMSLWGLAVALEGQGKSSEAARVRERSARARTVTATADAPRGDR